MKLATVSSKQGITIVVVTSLVIAGVAAYQVFVKTNPPKQFADVPSLESTILGKDHTEIERVFHTSPGMLIFAHEGEVDCRTTNVELNGNRYTLWLFFDNTGHVCRYILAAN